MNVVATHGSIQSSKSFFEQFPVEDIFKHWDSSTDLENLAKKLGFKDPKGLSEADYLYMDQLKNRQNWRSLVVSTNRQKERERYTYINKLSAQDLQKALDLKGIQTVSHLALHF